MHYVPKLDMRKKVAADLRSAFNADDHCEAQRLLKIKRGTRVATLFSNEESSLRLISAVLFETS